MTSDNGTWDRLNRDFYSSNPAGYFRDRLNLLALKASRSGELHAHLSEGVEVGRLW